MAVIGPNGSGKTALLKPVVFADWFITQSFQIQPDANIPIASHFAESTQPSEFEFLVDYDNRLWRYVLRCNQQRVLHEALYQKKERFGYVFVRDWDESNKNYFVKQQDFGMTPLEAKKVRQNASLISTAAQYGVPLAVELASHSVISNVNALGRRTLDESAVLNAAEYFSLYPNQAANMSKLLSTWDLGLSKVELKQVSAPTNEDPMRSIWVPFGLHQLKKGAVSLPFALESSGTQGAFVLLSLLLQALENGGIAVIDEFENDLHPHMIEPILNLFANPSINTKNAQLIFTCHAIEVLNLINKSQVILVEKNRLCESSVSRLDNIVGIRNDDNFYAKYMAGAYGAIPSFN